MRFKNIEKKKTRYCYFKFFGSLSPDAPGQTGALGLCDNTAVWLPAAGSIPKIPQ